MASLEARSGSVGDRRVIEESIRAGSMGQTRELEGALHDITEWARCLEALKKELLVTKSKLRRSTVLVEG